MVRMKREEGSPPRAPVAHGAAAGAPDVEGLRVAVLAWYAAAGRRLPFRGTTDLYRVLVSEVMLHQTQAGRVGEAYAAFLARFPTVEALAEAEPADVLRAWRGLGYNRRATNLWRAARLVVAAGGRFPDTPEALGALPGVGPYTARAVAAIAFGCPVGPVDTNVRRVLGRVAVGDPTGLSPSAVQRLADAMVPTDRPADWAHALMDLGATVCRARSPRCAECPVRSECRYASVGRVPATPARGVRHPALPFPASSRWLRGRIVDLLRDAVGARWVAVRGPIGQHDGPAVAAALEALAVDGLIERHPRHPQRARLPLGMSPAGPAHGSRVGAACRERRPVADTVAATS